MWPVYPTLSKAFLSQNRDVCAQHSYHVLLTHFLYPCGCKDLCACLERRESIELSLNVARYNAEQDTKQRYAMRLIFNIPEDDFFCHNYVNAYPLWLIQKELAQKNIVYKAVSRFVDALLHLGRTQGRCVSSFEALKLILGSSTLKMKAKTDYLGGERFYTAHFKTYRSLCAFIFAFMPPQKQEVDAPLAYPVEDIYKLFNLASSTRQLLLGLHTQNVKKKKMFFDHTLIKIPDWVHETTEPSPHVWGAHLCTI